MPRGWEIFGKFALIETIEMLKKWVRQVCRKKSF